MDVLCLTGYGDFTNRVNNAISLLQKNKKLNVHAIVFGKHNYNSLKLQSKSKYKKIVCVENLFEKIEKISKIKN